METFVKESTVSVPTKPLLRFHQREDYKGEIESMEAMIPQLKTPQDRGDVARRLGRLKQSLVTQSPVDLPGAAKDRLAEESKRLEATITEGMVTKEEMRKNPAGTVGYHMKWEAAKKAAILKWKNIQQMLEPDSADPDLSNIERLRPNGATDRVRLDAQIPGKMSYGNIPQERWDQAFEGKKPMNTALEQAKKPHMTMEQKERAKLNLATARAKMKELRAAKAAADAASLTVAPVPPIATTEG